MYKKGPATGFIVIICIATLVFSYFIWKEKLTKASRVGVSPPIMEQVAEENVSRIIEEETSVVLDLDVPTANMDENVRSLLKARFANEEKVQLLIVGSKALETGGNGGVAGLLAQQISATYGDFMETDIVTVSGTSRTFVDGLDTIIDWTKGYDLVLMEPFTLNNNGKVIIEDEHRHILKLREQVTHFTEDAIVLVTPSQPIYKPKFYLTQIRSLQKFTEARGIPYLDHWVNWPSYTSDEMLGYLAEDSAPNALGSQAWADALGWYFVGMR